MLIHRTESFSLPALSRFSGSEPGDRKRKALTGMRNLKDDRKEEGLCAEPHSPGYTKRTKLRERNRRGEGGGGRKEILAGRQSEIAKRRGTPPIEGVARENDGEMGVARG